MNFGSSNKIIIRQKRGVRFLSQLVIARAFLLVALGPGGAVAELVSHCLQLLQLSLHNTRKHKIENSRRKTLDQVRGWQIMSSFLYLVSWKKAQNVTKQYNKER